MTYGDDGVDLGGPDHGQHHEGQQLVAEELGEEEQDAHLTGKGSKSGLSAGPSSNTSLCREFGYLASRYLSYHDGHEDERFDHVGQHQRAVGQAVADVVLQQVCELEHALLPRHIAGTQGVNRQTRHVGEREDGASG